MGDRANQLERIVLETQEWVAFSEMDIWGKLKGKISDVIEQTKDAFWMMETDGKSDQEIIRNLMSQRAKIKTCYEIINMVEVNKVRCNQAKKEIEKIDEQKQKGRKK